MEWIKNVMNHKLFFPIELVLVVVSVVVLLPVCTVLGPYMVIPLIGVLGALIIELGMLAARKDEQERFMLMIKATLLVPVVLALLVGGMLLIISMQV